MNYKETIEKLYDGLVYDPKLKLEDAKGIAYSMHIFPKEDKILVTGIFSTFRSYNIFTLQEAREYKSNFIRKSLLAKSNPKDALVFSIDISSRLLNYYTNKETHELIDYIDGVFSLWNKEGLIYTIDIINKKVTFDVSDDRFTPNYMWALSTCLYRVESFY